MTAPPAASADGVVPQRRVAETPAFVARCGIRSPLPPADGPTFSIASFNARWGRTLADVPFDVASVVAMLDADVIALQEVWVPHDDPTWLEAAATERGYALVHVPLSPSYVDPRPEITAVPSEADGTWGVALLSRVPMRRVRTVDLGRLVERWDVADRHALLVEVEVDGTPLLVAAVHLSFALPNAAAQLRRLGGLLPRHLAHVVVGDCNLWGPPARALIGGVRPAVRGRTWPAHRPHSQLDHILVSPSVAVRSGVVLPPAGSDHLPVRAVLALD
jgi:endonuclease/exonuclease/phosphatase family metal-dependent hydrolase